MSQTTNQSKLQTSNMPPYVSLAHQGFLDGQLAEFCALGAVENWFTQSCLHTGSGSILWRPASFGGGNDWASCDN